MEVERARVTRMLSKILENSTPSKISEAAKTLCELQIETYGSMYPPVAMSMLIQVTFGKDRFLVGTSSSLYCCGGLDYSRKRSKKNQYKMVRFKG